MISSYFPTLKPLLWLLFAATIIGSCFCNGRSFNMTAGCIQIERQALLEIKSNLTDPSNRLASWSHTGADCCRWYGVVCDKVTGSVLELHLQSYFEDYHDSTTTSTDDYLESTTTTPSDEGYLKVAFGGKVSPSLLKLKHLRYLDLSNNNFGGIPIPKFLGFMESLRSLNLSNAGFGGKIPYQLGNLSTLHYLSIMDDYLNFQTDDLHWLSGLASLKFLELSNVEIVNTSSWLEDVNMLPSLKELQLSFCYLPDVKIPPLLSINFSSLSILDLSNNGLSEPSYLHWISQLQSLTSLSLSENAFAGPIPTYLQNLTSLRELDLSGNSFNSSIPKWLYGFRYLEILKLDSNKLLQGDMSSGFANLTSLTTLDLSSTDCEGQIPQSFKNLCNLRSLRLRGVKLKQEINEVLEILSGCVSNGLESLDLSYCQLSGYLSHHLGQFKALEVLYLSSNNISNPIPPCLGQLKSLKMLDFRYNKLNGTMPPSFGGLTKLECASFSNNMLVGDVLEAHFANLLGLKNFYAVGNQQRLRVSLNWSPPFQQIVELQLGSWVIGPQFPTWLRPLKSLSSLDLSNCGISNAVPSWFWKLSTQFLYLNLSGNKMEGVLPNKPSSFQLSMQELDLSGNLLKGLLPPIFSSIEYLDLSNNSLSGSLSNFLCSKIKNRTNSLYFLNVERNLLQGEMPNCWKNWNDLIIVRLSHNNLHGHIPKSFGTLRLLRSLHLRNNSLSGKIPLSLQNCRELFTLDLGENQLVGSVPRWIGERLSKLIILNLHKNSLHGPIHQEVCRLASLQILDLANNFLSGPMPNCVNNLTAMAVVNVSGNGIYLTPAVIFDNIESTSLVMKREEVEYNTILNLVRSIDLSSNMLFGEIPREITSLTGLQSLNLSHNLLIGKIPEEIGAMKSLESIDFSENQLFGEIPESLAALNFLSNLNLSNNNFSGRIPLGTQIQSFNSSSFSGNNKLCGKPLAKNCSEDGVASKPVEEKENASDGLQVDWFYVSMALGFIVGLGGVLGPLMFNRRWRRLYFIFLDHLGDKIYWSFH